MSSGPSPAIRILIIIGVMIVLGAGLFAFGIANKPSTSGDLPYFDESAFGESGFGDPADAPPPGTEAAADGWVVFRLPDSNAQVELPAYPATTDMLATPALASLRDSMVFARQHMTTANGFAVAVSHVRYVEGIEVSLDGAADGAISEIKATPVVKDIAATRERGTVGGYDGLFVSATIDANFGPDFLAEMFLFQAEGDLVHLSVTFPDTDAEGPLVWRRILNSLENTSATP